MGLIAPLATIFYAIAMIAFGIQHLFYGEFVTRVVPKLPAWIPSHSLWAYVTGVLLIVAGLAILFRKYARAAALLLGSLFLLSFFVFYLPMLRTSPPLGGLWTNAGKALALSGGAFLISGRLIPLGRIFLSAFFILAGVQHFLFVSFVANLVPRWIPGHVFWTYFAGVALIAGGVGILVPRTRRLAALLSGLMVLLWVVLLHIPRALAAPRDSNETTAVFEALAVSGIAFLVALNKASTGRGKSKKPRR